jgi:two-component system chemotaxis response regulator CheY
MPVKNGVDATREIISFDKDARVVMCSTIEQILLVKEAREAGARGFIAKPFTAEDITATLQQVMTAKFVMKKEVNRRTNEAITLMAA